MGQALIVGGRAGRLLPYTLAGIGRAYAKGIPCILLVPEQYTLQAEVDLMNTLQLPGFFDIQVLSPSRLSQRVFERAGQPDRTVLDARGKLMALSQALTANKKHLHYYQLSCNSPGMPEKLAALIGDMKRSGLSAEEYALHLSTLPDGAEKMKQEDIYLLWQAYEAAMAGRFQDGEDVEEEMLARLPKSGIGENAKVWVYGFDVLPPKFCRALCQFAIISQGVTVTMTMDKSDAPDGHIFTPMRHSAYRLEEMMKASGASVSWRYLEEEPLSAAPAIAHLEQNLFAKAPIAFTGDASAIQLWANPTPYQEVMRTLQEIAILHLQGVPYGDIAITVGSLSAYQDILPAVLESCHVPYYLDTKTPASRHGLVRFLLSALRAIAKGFPQGEMLALLKTGYAPIPAKACLLLENYAIEHGIHQGRWRKPFPLEDDTEGLEEARLALVTPLMTLREGLAQAKTAKESLTAVFHLLEQVGAYDTLIAQEQELLNLNMQAQASQNRQVWRQILGTLEQMNDLLDGRRAPSSHIAQWLEAGLLSIELSGLPPQPDTVLVGEIGHALPGQLQAVFVLGLQDEVLTRTMDSLLTQPQRDQLQLGTGIPLGLSQDDRSKLARTDLYKTLALPSHRLYLSHAQSSQDGASLRPALFLTTIKTSIFPTLSEEGGAASAGESIPFAPLPALDTLSLRLHSLYEGDSWQDALPPTWQAGFQWLYQHPTYHQEIEKILLTLNTRIEATPIPPNEAPGLFGQEAVSISRLEEYAQCPYKHFIRYGLAPVPRREYAYQPDERGTFFHNALFQYGKKALDNPSWPQISQQDSDQMMDALIPSLTEPWEDGPLAENKKAAALGKRYLRIIKRAAWMFTQHQQKSSFSVAGLEVTFGMPGGLPPVILELPDGSRVALRGVIDRIDRYEGDDGVYLRVVDYKSSAQTLDPTAMWYGLQLQLMLYLDAAVSSKQGALPAGAFYFLVQDPMIESDTDIKAAAERVVAQKLRLKGITLSQVEIVHAMDQEEGFSLEKIFLKKEGKVSKTASALDLKQMGKLMRHLKSTAAQLTYAMRSGDIGLHPAQIKTWTACQYCDYRAICGWDPSLPGAQPRCLPNITPDELRERLGD